MSFFKKVKALFIKKSNHPTSTSSNEVRQNQPEHTPTPQKKKENGPKNQHTRKSGNHKHQNSEQKGSIKNDRNHNTPKPSQKKKPKSKKPTKQVPQLPTIVEAPKEEGKVRFTDLNIRKEILGALQDLKFHYGTPIQAESLPFGLAGKDIAGKAQTGTGKTAAFLIPAINHILNNPIEGHRRPGSTRVIILAPTRELAIQIHKDAESLSKYTNLNNLAIFGGMGHQQQQDRLRQPIDILVATPGRCIDYCNRRTLDLSQAEILIIDEADRMLDMGFVPDVRKIVNKTPHPGRRHTMMYSATLEGSVLRLINSWQKDPVTVEIESEEIVTDLIDQRFYSVMGAKKLALLMNIIKSENIERMLIFINRKDTAARLHKSLKRYGIEVDELTGDVPQQKRIKILEDLRSGKIKILIATDVAARGIHINNISHVINYDLPVKAEDYIHRIGRTGRAGSEGKAYSFVCESGAYAFCDIEEILEEQISCVLPDDEQLVLPAN